MTNPDIMRRLADDRLAQRRREARDHRLAARGRGRQSRRRPGLSITAWFGRRREPSTRPRTAAA